MKSILISAALVVAAPAMAETTRATIEDVFATVVESTPYTRQVCQNVEVPIYGTVTRQGGGASGGDILGGMILGGLLGKGVTGKDDGAAAGAVLGGIIAADKANKPIAPGGYKVGYFACSTGVGQVVLSVVNSGLSWGVV